MIIKSMENAFSLRGKNAIVTGGYRGIGLGITEAFAQQGANVAVLCRDPKKAQDVIGRLNDSYEGRFIAIQTDIADRGRCKASTTVAIAALGDIDILVNNAGIGVEGKLLDMDESLEDWENMLNVNLSGAFRMSYFVGKHMREHKKGGRIINISSNAGEMVNKPVSLGAYSVAKAGLNRLTKYLAYEFAEFGVRVNAIAPGYTNSDLMVRIGDADYKTLIDKIPVGRFGEIQEVGALAVYLASGASDNMTGVILTLDGGYSLAI